MSFGYRIPTGEEETIHEQYCNDSPVDRRWDNAGAAGF
jgi:hypothetical protein